MEDLTFTLNTGAKIPAVGLGTWQSSPGEVTKAVSHALAVGYKHIDCAFCYQNEAEVGDALKPAFSSGSVSRSDIFITSKLWCTYHRRVSEAVDLSLKALGVDYLDLYLMHWPIPMKSDGNHPLFPRLPDGSRDLEPKWTYVDTWHEMEKVLETGKVKAIGVANFSVKYLENLLQHSKVTPAVNQVELHPYLPQQELIDYCHSKNIHVTAYSPFGSSGSPLMKEEEVQKVATKYNVAPGTVLLSYGNARGTSVIPKSVNPSRIDENRKLIKLKDEDLKALNEIHVKKGIKRFVYPDFGVDLAFPDKS